MALPQFPKRALLDRQESLQHIMLHDYSNRSFQIGEVPN